MLDKASRALKFTRKQTLPAEAWATFDAIVEDAVRDGVVTADDVMFATGEARRALAERLTAAAMSTMDGAASDADRALQAYGVVVNLIERALRTFPAVRITGLTGSPELNGQVAEIMGERTGDAELGTIRYPVRLVARGRDMLVKPQNLRGCRAPSSSIEDQD